MGLSLFLIASLAVPGSAKADGLAVSGDEIVVSVDRPDYHYEAPKGSNLTYLARRSLQLETEGSGVISGAPLVATETCVVQALGARNLIHIGEEIVVGGQVIDDCLEQTAQLTEVQLDCWARYLPIRENLDWIEPVFVGAVAIGEEGPADDLADIEIGQDSSQADEAADNGGSSFSNWYWWLIAGFVFGLGWYFMVLGRTWRSSPEDVADQPESDDDDKKVSQSEKAATPVESKDSGSKDSKNKKSKPRKRNSNKKS